MSNKRFEIKEYSPLFKSVRVLHTTDDEQELNEYISKRRNEYPDNDYYYVDNWRDGVGNLCIPQSAIAKN